MPPRRKRRENRRRRGASALKIARFRFRHHLKHIDPAQEGLEIRLEFDLNIEEGADPVMDETIGQIQQDARAIIEQGGQEIAEAAQEAAPVKTGALRASIYYMVEDVNGLTIGATVPYASYVEYGTRHMSPRLFLTGVVWEHQPMIQAELDEMIADRLAQDTDEDDPEFEFNRTMEEAGP